MQARLQQSRCLAQIPEMSAGEGQANLFAIGRERASKRGIGTPNNGFAQAVDMIKTITLRQPRTVGVRFGVTKVGVARVVYIRHKPAAGGKKKSRRQSIHAITSSTLNEK